LTEQKPQKLDYLNLGCGSRFLASWSNVDFVARSDNVIAHDLTKGIPFPNDRFDAIYHSHLLEHFTREAGKLFLRECFRVLRRGGVLRVVVPDLERIVRSYLVALEEATKGSKEWSDNYNWILLEMYDQAVRSSSGGQMAAYLTGESVPNRDFISRRCGTELLNLMEGNKTKTKIQANIGPKCDIRPLLVQVGKYLRMTRWRELFIRLILGKEYNTLKIGRFRQNGEVHQWMYDRYSLKAALAECGFERIIEQSPTTSLIPFWVSFNLDTEPDGSVYKPQSIFVEGVK
jgi:predicted SAM-dependent methyltransferase